MAPACNTGMARRSSSTHRPRVLVVDDERLLADLLAEALEDAGYDVQCAYDGLQALETLMADPRFDAVLSDVRMPRLQGTDLAIAARRVVSDAQMPILLLSASPAPPLLEPDVWFFAKPVDIDRLLDHLALVLHDPAQRAN